MQFDQALEVIAGVIRDGAASHPDNDWVERTPEFHIQGARLHLSLLCNGDRASREDHLAHAACRILMALTLREQKAYSRALPCPHGRLRHLHHPMKFGSAAVAANKSSRGAARLTGIS
jgi:hypothetical protein